MASSRRWFIAAMLVALFAAVLAAPAAASDEAGEPPPTEAPPPTEESPPDDPPGEASPSPETAPPADPPPPAEGTEPPPDETVVADEPAFDPSDPEQILRPIVFPVVGVSSYSPTFGACRDGCTRLHEGIDIMTYGWKGVPVVAAHDGVVTWANVGGRLAGCGLVIRAADGWSTVYTHLNTDTPGTDDGEAPCFPADIEVGAFVRAGTLIGWVGDAGNAEETPPHLHFEIQHPDHGPVDPMVSLDAAVRIHHRWIDPSNLAAIAPDLASDDPTAYVVPAHRLDLVASAAPDLATIDVPLIPFDIDDPTPAWTAVHDTAPERIVIITDDPADPVIGALSGAAAIVEAAIIPSDPELPAPVLPVEAEQGTTEPPIDDAEAPVEDAEETRIDWYETAPVEDTIVLATTRRPSGTLIDALAEHAVIVLVGTRPPRDPGHPSADHPGPDANRDALWWPTADGWRIGDEAPSVPASVIAYAAGSDLAPWTLAYLVSRDAAPQLPLWHYQPTSRAVRSL